ncbi:MAG: hypothetical protein GX621_02780 [Pirellulaceae bacterium]|nr:hypothetical protein [Pirellulaceae bacterium]
MQTACHEDIRRREFEKSAEIRLRKGLFTARRRITSRARIAASLFHLTAAHDGTVARDRSPTFELTVHLGVPVPFGHGPTIIVG